MFTLDLGKRSPRCITEHVYGDQARARRNAEFSVGEIRALDCPYFYRCAFHVCSTPIRSRALAISPHINRSYQTSLTKIQLLTCLGALVYSVQ